MSIECLHYWPLAGMLGLGLLFYWHRRSAAPLSPRRRKLALVLRGLIFILLILALTEPRWIGQRREQAVIWLVDASRSVGSAARDRALAFAAEAGKQKTYREERFIAFAGNPVEVQGTPAAFAEALPKVADDRTDLAAALAFADASFPPGFAKTAVLFTDGQETHGDILRALPKLKASGVRVCTVPVEPPDRPEVLVRAVTAPHQANENEPFEIAAEVVSNRESAATLEVFRNGPRVATREVRLKRGVNRFKMTQSVSGEKTDEFTVAVKAKEDTIADNNRASAFVRSSGKTKALLLADKPDQARYLARALQQEGILLDVRPAKGAPADMGDLQNYDLLILDNVSATEFTREQMGLYASYVRDFGGGLLMLGGELSFGLGGYYRTPVEDVLPVRCDFEKEQENPSLALMLIIDRSGSMSGEKVEMAKDAAKAAVELLGPKDYVGVIAFDNESFWVADLQSASDKSGVQQKIGSIEAGGGTAMAPAMEMALSRLQTSSAKLKHVIILTDGVSTPGPFYELATQMAQQRITLSTVGVGGDTDQDLLKKVSEWGNGRFYFTDNPSSIPQIFTKETMTAAKSAIRDMPFLPVQVAPADFLNGLDFSGAPFLLGYVNTKTKPTSELWLVTEKQEPLLATWRCGLGQSGAFTSDARNRWAVDWLKWEGYGKFWAQTCRKLMRTAALKHQPSQLTREGDDFVFTVDCMDERGNYASDLTGELTLLSPDNRASKLPLQATGPGRFTARWPAKHGAWHAQVTLKNGDQTFDQQYASISAGYPDEFLLRPLDEAKLRAIAKETGGAYSPATLPNDRTAPVERELWPWLALLALLLFIADVAAKRWPDNAALSRPPKSLSPHS
ncbi:MAG: VWA domain-containing protein [Chthoniobacteraceae bacterium]